MSTQTRNQSTTEAPLFDTRPLQVYNSLSRKKEPFRAINPPLVGLYVCGPTVYSEPHLGHARTAIVFDVVYRYLSFLGYRVRYVRNITDVGHLEDEVADEGEDKIAKRARLDRLEPMEIVQRYANAYHESVNRLNCRPPSIEPRASGHIPEQIDVVKRIEKSGFAYEADGSVYFDLEKYAKQHDYGKLSGKVFEDLMSGTRGTAGKDQKHSPLDFALWKKAEPSHIMRWDSPWGEGFPGWHLECTTMSTKYLGERFDIHGGGLDLQFPHHEAEIAQNHGAFGTQPANYWLHGNMLTIENQKMAKSAGNFITLNQMFSGTHPKLERAYSPMVVRFFVLQSHYRSVTDFSNEALHAADKGYRRLMTILQGAEALLSASPRLEPQESPESCATRIASEPVPAPESGADKPVVDAINQAWGAMSDDFHTPKLIAQLFELGHLLQGEDVASISEPVRTHAAATAIAFATEVLGLASEESGTLNNERLDAVLSLLIEIRAKARKNRDFALSDQIRDRLKDAGIQLEDRADGTTGYSLI